MKREPSLPAFDIKSDEAGTEIVSIVDGIPDPGEVRVRPPDALHGGSGDVITAGGGEPVAPAGLPVDILLAAAERLSSLQSNPRASLELPDLPPDPGQHLDAWLSGFERLADFVRSELAEDPPLTIAGVRTDIELPASHELEVTPLF